VAGVSHFLFMMKNTPDSLSGAWKLSERILEQTPIVNHFAATVCIVADAR